ncbi:hypothetical protein ANTQUA_LOCUS3123 [Anthophora quadrimaculata]
MLRKLPGPVLLTSVPVRRRRSPRDRTRSSTGYLKRWVSIRNVVTVTSVLAAHRPLHRASHTAAKPRSSGVRNAPWHGSAQFGTPAMSCMMFRAMLIGGAGMAPLTAMPARPAPLPMLPVLLPLIGPGMTVPPAPRGTRGALHRHAHSLALSPGGCWQFFWFLPGLHRGGWIVFDGLVGRGGAAAGNGALLAAPPLPDPYPVLLV